MKEETVLKLAITPHFRVSIDKEDGTTEEWRLCLDYRSLALIEDEVGLDLKNWEVWQSISNKQFPQIVHGSLRRFNPEVSLDQVLDVLSPGVQRIVSDELLYLCFPDAREAFKKFQAAKETGATDQGNVPTVPQTA
jgi:hypothetical protein